MKEYQIEETIIAYFDGRLSDEESAELMHRVSVSPEIRQLFREHETLQQMASSAARNVSIRPAVEEGLFARIASLQDEERKAAAALAAATVANESLVVESFVAESMVAESIATGAPVAETVVQPVRTFWSMRRIAGALALGSVLVAAGLGYFETVDRSYAPVATSENSSNHGSAPTSNAAASESHDLTSTSSGSGPVANASQMLPGSAFASATSSTSSSATASSSPLSSSASSSSPTSIPGFAGSNGVRSYSNLRTSDAGAYRLQTRAHARGSENEFAEGHGRANGGGAGEASIAEADRTEQIVLYPSGRPTESQSIPGPGGMSARPLVLRDLVLEESADSRFELGIETSTGFTVPARGTSVEPFADARLHVAYHVGINDQLGVRLTSGLFQQTADHVSNEGFYTSIDRTNSVQRGLAEEIYYLHRIDLDRFYIDATVAAGLMPGGNLLSAELGLKMPFGSRFLGGVTFALSRVHVNAASNESLMAAATGPVILDGTATQNTLNGRIHYGLSYRF